MHWESRLGVGARARVLLIITWGYPFESQKDDLIIMFVLRTRIIT